MICYSENTVTLKKSEPIVEEVNLCQITLGKSVVAADPCYDDGVWCAEFDIAMKEGTYEVHAVRGGITSSWTNEEGEEQFFDWGSRVARLRVIRTGETVEHWEGYNALGVDTARMSIWDAEHYEGAKNGAREWSEQRHVTERGEYWWAADEHGCWTDTGFGDGSYFCYRGFNAEGEPVSLSVVFLYNDDIEGEIHIDDEQLLPFIDGPASLWDFSEK